MMLMVSHLHVIDVHLHVHIHLRPLFLPPPLLYARFWRDNVTTLFLIGTLNHIWNSKISTPGESWAIL
jgi:hypothetical protein